MINYNLICSHFPVIKSDNLILRELKISDLSDYLEIGRDADFVRLYRNNISMSEYDARMSIENLYPKTFKEQKDITWAICEQKNPNIVIGLRDVFFDSVNTPVETQVFIRQEFRNMGYNQEALLAVLDFLKSVGTKNVKFNCDSEDEVVIHIAEKLGFYDMSMFGGFSFDRKNFLKILE